MCTAIDPRDPLGSGRRVRLRMRRAIRLAQVSASTRPLCGLDRMCGPMTAMSENAPRAINRVVAYADAGWHGRGTSRNAAVADEAGERLPSAARQSPLAGVSAGDRREQQQGGDIRSHFIPSD